MHFRANSIGYAVPRTDFDAVVHSVFRFAVNLRPARSNRLLTLVASGQADVPQGIRLDASGELSFDGLQTGALVLCRDGLLQFENSPLTVQLRGARHWKCDFSALEVDPSKPAISAAWSSVWGMLNQQQRHSGAEIIADDLFRSPRTTSSVVTRKAGEALRDLVTLTQGYDLADSSAIRALIGLGSGLTPSGDDLLVGYLAGLWCTIRGKSDRAQFIASLGRRIIHLSMRTNDISRTYLYHAAHGQVSSLLADLAGNISRGENSRRLLDSAKAVMGLGHSSGMDAVTGLLVGMFAWDKNPAGCTITSMCAV